jgi:hypothetical protein
MLRKLPKILFLNKECYPVEVIMNIVHGKFTVLTNDGKSSIKHACPDDCIDSKTERGKKLIERINKMLKRGWILRNENCPNVNCVLHQIPCVPL